MTLRTSRICQRILECDRCRLARTRRNALCGEGDPAARLMLVAQAPGENEDREGVMFIGPSGKVLGQLLDIASVPRESVYMTNLVKCMLPGYRKPKSDEIEACSVYLDEEIELVDPEVLVPMGYFATRYLLDKYSLDVPGRKSFGELYGNLMLADGGKLLPLEHPAAVVYDSAKMELLSAHYRKLGVLSKECKWYDMCPMKRYYRAGILDRKWVELYCKGDWSLCVRYEIEESGMAHPDWMLPDGSIDHSLRETAGI
ncbi:uracil-DNA glycosylase [Candidatus Fermentibacteria bacterium]|nr:uracil-DNA glycosylase [Candidatus Fermentibacteria bacterium]